MHHLFFRPGSAIPSIRENLQNSINALDLSDRKIGAAIEVDHSSVSKWRKGKHFPEPENLERLARFLGVDPLELLMTPDQQRLWQALKKLRGDD